MFPKQDQPTNASLIRKTIGKKSCELCFAIEGELNKDRKFEKFSSGGFNGEDEYICNVCEEDIRNIRKRCNQVISNPSQHSLKDLKIDFFNQFKDTIIFPDVF